MSETLTVSFATKNTQGGLNHHIMTYHLTVRFTCAYCNKQFATSNGHYKHEQSHSVFTHKCPYLNCNASFQFPSGLKAHKKSHTKKGLFQCLHCSIKYMTNRAMKQHAQKHTNQPIQCPKCPITFKTNAKFKQHFRCRHGEGYIVSCGEKKVAKGSIYTQTKVCYL